MSHCFYNFFIILVLYLISEAFSDSINNSTEVRFSAVRYLVTKKPNNIDKPTRNIFQWQSINTTTLNLPNNTTDSLTQTKKILRKSRKGLKKRRKNRKLKRRQRLLLADQQATEPIGTQPSIELKSLDSTIEKKLKKHKKNKLKNKKNKGKDKKEKKHKKDKKTILKDLNLTVIEKNITKTSDITKNNIIADNETNIVKIIRKDTITEQNILKQQIQFNKIQQRNQKPPLRNDSSVLLQKLLRQNFYMICGNKYCDHSCLDDVTSTCGCYRGFRLAKDGIRCMDINECKIDNGNCSHMCNNMPGSYRCKCPEGYRIGDDGKTCQDINECLLRNGHGHCQDTCKNTNGSFECGCENLPGTQLNSDGHTCGTMDLCSKAGCSHICINTAWNAFCTCPVGYQLDNDWKTCKDVNECDDPDISASCKLGCINTIGSYKCVQTGEIFQNDQHFQNSSCAKLEQPQYGYIHCYNNKEYISKHQTQFSSGTVCHLICPKHGFRKSGKFKQICIINGKWIGPKDGKCVKQIEIANSS